MAKCLYCFSSFNTSGVGRLPVYCSISCKQAAYRFRKNGFRRFRVSSAVRSLSLPKAGGTGQISLTLRNAGCIDGELS